MLTTNTASTLYVRPFNGNNTTALGRYRRLNPGLGCLRGTPYTLSAAEAADPANAAGPTTVCQQDLVNDFGTITPNIERFGGSARGTVTVGADSEAYVLFNFQQSTVDFTGGNATIRADAPTGINFPRFSTRRSGPAFAAGSGPLTLPVFICAAGANCDTAADRRLNPSNPFAAQGQVAQLIGRLPDIQTFNQTRSQVYRVAGGLSGTVMTDLDYQIDATAMYNDLRRTQNGNVRIANLLTAIGTGSYNFLDPFSNSQAARDAIAPDNITDSSSELYQLQATIAKPLFDLPGGPLQLGLGGAIRYEAVDAPSSNNDANGPTQRYFTLNAFGTSGSRKVYSAFAELDAPVFEALDINASARYDKYSSGQDAFSPKIGARFEPFRQFAVRGTYSRGFRIPSFAEANALPTTGFVTVSVASLPQSFLSQYGAGCTAANANACPGYITNYARGLTTLASPNLNPEKSRSFTGGVVFEPTSRITLTADYYNIKKTGAITTPSTAGAIAAYFAGAPIPAGFNVIADAPDPNFPNALPRIAFVESNLVNANTIKSSGVDFGAIGRFRFGDDIRFTTSAQASYIIELSTTDDQGVKESYAGSLGNFNLTAGSGTPRWRATWQNTIETGPFTFTGTANYFDGYNLSAEDQTGPGTRGGGGLNPGYVPDNVSDYVTVDLVASFKAGERFTFYVNALNVLDDLPPIDPVTYGAYLYNPVQGGLGILGRQFRAGVRVGF